MAVIKNVAIVYAASSIALAFGCTVGPMDDGAADFTAQSAASRAELRVADDCDPATFPGGLCDSSFRGETTFSDFIGQLQTTHQADDWKFRGSQLNVNLGNSFDVENVGGEVHTFSVVENFGGGRVQILNDLTGETTVAPECVNGPTATNVDIAAGGSTTVTTGANGAMPAPGTFKVQCCIHPWMRATVAVQ